MLPSSEGEGSSLQVPYDVPGSSRRLGALTCYPVSAEGTPELVFQGQSESRRPPRTASSCTARPR